MSKPIFRTKNKKPGKPKSGDWTNVVCESFDADGNNAGEVIINSLGGSGGGSSEAKRLCILLNEAWDTFHRDGDAGLELNGQPT